ncbi:hypothetical protein, partial [Bacillus cereus]|uniref:hypothetical protein n=1 Tax=Bacillus cereus TaxID=1396 RepID=UPI001D0D00A3
MDNKTAVKSSIVFCSLVIILFFTLAIIFNSPKYLLYLVVVLTLRYIIFGVRKGVLTNSPKWVNIEYLVAKSSNYISKNSRSISMKILNIVYSVIKLIVSCAFLSFYF